MSHVAFPIVVAVALAIFAWTMAGRAKLLLAAKPAGRFDRIPERIKRTAVYAFGQKKFLKGEQPAGIMHAVIFWAFVILGLQVVTLFGRAEDAHWHIPGLGPSQAGPAFYILRDLLEFSVIIAVSYALYRRLIAHTPRLFGIGRAEERYRNAPHWEGILILTFILFIMIGGLLHDAGHLVQYDIHNNERHWAPFTALVAAALGGLSRSQAETVSQVGWWLHNLTVLTFLNLLPLSKHFHIITAVPNVFFGKLPPKSAERTLPITKVPAAAPVAALDPPPGGSGIKSLAEVSWKSVLDAFSCTECGRCTAQCPATASGSPLAPRQFILDLRDALYEHPEIQKGGDGASLPTMDQVGDRENGGVSDLGKGATDDQGVRISGSGISQEVLWSCTTCMACVEACPVGIEHVPAIIDMRRGLVDQGHMEPLLQQTLENFAKQGNSYGKSGRMRARWTKGLDFQIPDARKEPVEYLWFVGDFASFDERVQDASRRVAKLLKRAGLSYGLLYDGERNAGNDVRRVGEEGLFEMLVEHNMKSLEQADFQAIVTTDPHSLNALRNEYPAFGLDKPVYHYTELLIHLVQTGKLDIREPLDGYRVTYHDPCYLARYNRITDAPRDLIAASGAELVEMPRHGTNTFCCGAGGGRIWMDDSKLTERPSEQRIREAQGVGSLDAFVVSCPKDLAMYSDAAKTVGAEFEVLELTALLERALGPDPDAAAVGAAEAEPAEEEAQPA